MKQLDTLGIARELEGIGTVKSVQNRLNVNRIRAIYLLHRLRKKGYVRTFYQSNKVRVYRISPEYALGGTNYIEIINKYSPIKLAMFEIHQIYGRKPSIEETLVYALCKNSVRYVIASLSLFRKVRDWNLLYRLAKEKDIVREIAALYDIARLYLPKLRKMPLRFNNSAIPKKSDRYKYIIDGLRSDNFQSVENKWKVYIPLNAADLREYRGVFIS